MKRARSIVIAVTVIAIASMVIYGLAALAWSNRPLAFEPGAWAAADPDKGKMRLRMVDDLLRRMRAEQWSDVRTINVLGPPSSDQRHPWGGRRLTYALAPPATLSLALDNVRLELTYESDGSLARVHISRR
jgi:hypothetical protein